MNFLIANYGNESMAMIQWAISVQLEPFVVLSVDTNWHSTVWQQHLAKVFLYLSKNSINYEHLSPQQDFSKSVLDRGSFPSIKYQWCAPFLKGLPLNDAMDRLDINAEGMVYLPKMKAIAKANKFLSSDQQSEHYQGRIINYPLLNFSIAQRDSLIKKSGFSVLSHRSDECMPCIHARNEDIQRMSTQDKKRLEMLEKKVEQKMFPYALKSSGDLKHNYDMGCGNVWGCGE